MISNNYIAILLKKAKLVNFSQFSLRGVYFTPRNLS